MKLFQIKGSECSCLSVGKDKEQAIEKAWEDCWRRDTYENLLKNEYHCIRKLARKSEFKTSCIDEVKGYKISFGGI